MIRAFLWTALCVAPGLIAPLALQAQEEGFPGVSLGLLYESAYRPTVGVKPFTAGPGGEAVASAAEAILGRDLRYSDRFEILDSLPASLMGEGMDYTLWDQLGADWVVTAQAEAVGDSHVLLIQLHDITYGQAAQRTRVALPSPTDPGFRMAVHTAADQVVQWISGEPGMAASRILFAREVQDREGGFSKELYLVDSDGENLRRITNFEDITLSPTWSPSGEKVAFLSFKSGLPLIYEMDLATGAEKTLSPNRTGQAMTPSYHPNGDILAFSIADGAQSGLFSYDFSRDCCLMHLSGGRHNDLSPTYSPDGTRIAFNSNRLGTTIPQIYVMAARGGEAELISPYVYGRGGYYTSPDWSPTGDQVAFHGRIRRGRYQILVADVEDGGRKVIQLTDEGNNEDPSWAPDGRHLVFVGERNWGFGLFVVDAVTGRLRTLVGGVRASVPDWSPSLAVEGPDRLPAGGS